jgi:hypothetical protein
MKTLWRRYGRVCKKDSTMATLFRKEKEIVFNRNVLT